MSTTRLNLGEHLDAFIQKEVSCGRYESAREVVRDALRQFEERQRTLEALRRHLGEGEAEARRGEFVDYYSIESILADSEREV